MDVTLHPRQAEIFHDPHRFKVVAAGRRFGKSFLAAVSLFYETAKTEKLRSDGVLIDLLLEEVYYIAPTFEQGKKILWPLLKLLGTDLIQSKYENTGELTLINGRRLSIKGADRPDSLRGVGLSHVVLDEYAFMKEEVWEVIILPALARSEGTALFIGTPDGMNHFYTLYTKITTKPEEWADWRCWNFPSTDNPHLSNTEIMAARARMGKDRFRQEFEASFESGGGLVMTRDMFPIVDRAPSGDIYMACDLAGFVSSDNGKKISKTDDHALAVVCVHNEGWCVLDIVNGKWDTRQTALQIVKCVRDHRPNVVGIEKGMAKMAVMPYLQDEMARLNIYFNVEEVTHGNQRKADRIAWALQGRAEKGRITLLKGDWNAKFLQQVDHFPNPLAHDDLIDALAYIDQVAQPYVDNFGAIDDWVPLDDISAY